MFSKGKISILGKTGARVCRAVLAISLIAQVAFDPSLAEAGKKGIAYGNCLGDMCRSINSGDIEFDRQQANDFENEIQDFKSAGAQDLPGPSSVDTFHLTTQYLEVYQPIKDSFIDRFKTAIQGHPIEPLNLKTGGLVKQRRESMLNMVLPDVPYADFDHNVQVEMDPANNRLSLGLWTRDGGMIARHIFEGFKPVTYAIDKELLTFLDASGKVFSIDIGYARTKAFHGPVPVFEVADLGRTFKAPGEVSSAYLTRGLEEFGQLKHDEGIPFPADKRLDAVYTAGDFLVMDPQQRKMIGLFDRNVIRTQVYTGESILVALVQPFVRPGKAIQRTSLEDGETIVDRTSHVAGSGKLTDAQIRQWSSQLDPLTRKAIIAMGFDSIDKLAKQALLNKDLTGALRDKFTYEEFIDGLKRLRKEAIRQQQSKEAKRANKAAIQTLGLSDEDPDLEIASRWQQLDNDSRARAIAKTYDRGIKGYFHRTMDSTAMKYVGGIIKYGGPGAIAIYGTHLAIVSHSSFWAVVKIQQIYNHLWPAVLRNATYRVTMIKSVFSLSWLIPIMYSVGFLSSSITGADWSAQKGLALITWRMVAVAQYSWLKRLATKLNQETFIRSLQLNINPFRKVKADSAVGRQLGLEEDIYPGLINPRASHADRDAKAKLNGDVLTAVYYQNARSKALAWSLALIVESENSEIDPVTLAMLMKDKTLKISEIERLANDKNFRARWTQTAQEYELLLRNMEELGTTEDVKDIPPEIFQKYYEQVKALSAEIKSRTGAKSAMAQLRLRWHRYTENLMPIVANYGESENMFLSTAVPDDFVVRTFWSGFWENFYFMLVQKETTGARANFAKPEDLAAASGRFMWTSPGFRAEMIQEAMLGPVGTTGMGLIYQRLRSPVEKMYDPIEQATLLGKMETEGYFQGMYGVLKGAFNLYQAGYGYIWAKSLQKKGNMLQFILPMNIIVRMVFAGKMFMDATLGSLYILAGAGNWHGGWIWDVARRALQMHEQGIEYNEEILAQSKSRLGQALRLDDANDIPGAYHQLRELYRDTKRQLPEDMLQLMDSFDVFIERYPEVASQVTPKANAVLEAQEDLSLSLVAESETDARIDVQNVPRLEEAKNNLAALYAGTEYAADVARLKDNARSFLEFSLEHPPFATKIDPRVRFTMNFLSSTSACYLSTFVTAFSLHSGVHWGKVFPPMLLASGALYMGTYWGQRLIDRFTPPVADYVRTKGDEVKTKVQEIRRRNCLIELRLGN